MSNIPSGTKFLGLASSFPTTELRSARNNSVQDYYTVEDLIYPSVQDIVSAATITPASTDEYIDVTALATEATIANPTGTFVNGQNFLIRIADDGTQRTLTFGAKYKAFGSALPATTTVGKDTLIGCVYNANNDTFSTFNSIEQ